MRLVGHRDADSREAQGLVSGGSLPPNNCMHLTAGVTLGDSFGFQLARRR